MLFDVSCDNDYDEVVFLVIYVDFYVDNVKKTRFPQLKTLIMMMAMSISSFFTTFLVKKVFSATKNEGGSRAPPPL